MHQRKADGEPEPDLLAHDRPVAIGAVAAAFTLKRDEHNTPPLHETEYSGKIFADNDTWDDEPAVPFIR
ncbi:hypothetical protein ABID08_004135 [Rhizobium binae]|uniref:Uncharacterized protein n=1 Tax=Rhizobium binae TaxID=1138190 RepID=A0ABV2MJX4_9HYPH|nr:hypothetical protein [Rhizobium binae]MBX4927255.1 hypothetical protein [Rhizobium binae]MBX4994312.1 hypothetical protein [Rhizobium binae]NKL52323.1 hypothetical protein [Rhizobium leguminosarum bv. viciae]QSY84599.1 hypothetical protein J2J99_23720 [Rhizobium binae]